MSFRTLLSPGIPYSHERLSLEICKIKNACEYTLWMGVELEEWKFGATS